MKFYLKIYIKSTLLNSKIRFILKIQLIFRKYECKSFQEIQLFID